MAGKDAVQVGESNFKKALFLVEGKKDPIYVQFNPEEYNSSENIRYFGTSKRSDKGGNIQYAGNEKKTISLTLYYDTTQIDAVKDQRTRKESDVSEKTSQITSLAKYDDTKHRPPLVTFKWGSISFHGVVTKVVTTFTQFTIYGKPVRAKVQVDMSELIDSKEDQNKSPDRTKSRVLTEDIDIWTIAYREYGDAGKWREIAKANGIMNPLDVATGTVLRVPALKG